MARLLRVSVFSALLGVALSGCPREPDAPDPGMGTACEQRSDCNPDTTCGLLRLCVDGFCEEEAQLVIPCEGAGEPVVEP